MNPRKLLICSLFAALVSSAQAQSQPAVAGTLFVDLKAADFNAATGLWANKAAASPGNFTAVGAPTLVANVNGTGIPGVQFQGVNANTGVGDAFLGPVAPAAITGNGARSVEVWVFNPFLISGNEESMVAWGHRGTTDANQNFGYSTDAGWGASAHWGDDMGWGPFVPKCGVWHHLVYTYDGARNNCVYCDGALYNTYTLSGAALITFAADPILLGAQSDSGGGQVGTGQPLSAFLSAVRVESGALTASQVITNYLLGVGLTAPGALQTVSMAVPPLYYGGFTVPTVTASFANKTNIDVRRLATLQSSDTNVIVVLADNSLQAVGHGSATITAAFQSAQTTQTVAVVDTLPAGQLIHRYSFSEAQGATNLVDSVGAANGVLEGAANATLSNGQLALPGGTANPDGTFDTAAAYVDLPNGLISGLTNVTLEAWVTWTDPSTTAWERIFDFGSSAGGEDLQNGGVSYLLLTPYNGAGIDFEVRALEGRPDQALSTGSPMLANEEIHVAAVYNFSLHTMSIYTNGILAASGTATVPLSSINDINDWLGRSQFEDPFFNGSLDEFRIYNGVLSSSAIAGSYASGTETPGTNPGALQALYISVSTTNMTPGHTTPSTVTANFALINGVILQTSDGLTFASSNTNVASVNANGVVSAVGPGTARITATYQGMTSSAVTVTVSPLQGIAVAGTLYVDLRAADFDAFTGVWANKAAASPGDFVAVGAPTLVNDVNGSGIAGVEFQGVNANTGLGDAFLGPTAPAAITGNGSRSVEVWVLNPFLVVDNEESMVAWGHRGTTDANQNFGYSPDTGWGASAHWGDDMGWGPVEPKCGVWHHLVYTYDGARNNCVYCDGVLYNTYTLTGAGLITFANDPILLGAQSDNGGGEIGNGQPLTAFLSVVRVESGALNASDVLNNYLEGVNASNPGSLESISLKVPPLYFNGFSTPALAANFANNANVDITRLASLASSDTNVILVLADNSLQAVGHGSATITASFLSGQTSQTVPVLDTLPAAQLLHRYSFSETQGTTNLVDSVGGADGALYGAANASLLNGQLTLPGGTANPDGTFNTDAAYVDLPAGLISGLTNATIEAWVTWNDASSTSWERVFDFGTSIAGQGIQNGGVSYLLLNPQSGNGVVRTEIRPPEGRPDEILETSSPLPVGTATYVAVVYNYNLHSLSLFTNGLLAGSMTTTVPLSSVNDVNDWLGRSQFEDPFFNGSLDEFRIWNGALTAAQVAQNYAAGPNVLPTPITLQAQLSGGKLVLTWTGGSLLQSSSVAGPYTVVSGNPQSPYSVIPTGPRMFYRVQGN
jgi:hypothetical protein